MISSDIYVRFGPGTNGLIKLVDGMAVIVGPNNSGKTRILRSLKETAESLYQTSILKLRLEELITRDAEPRLRDLRISAINYLNRTDTASAEKLWTSGEFKNALYSSGANLSGLTINGLQPLEAFFPLPKSWMLIESERIQRYDVAHSTDIREISPHCDWITERLFKAKTMIEYKLFSEVQQFREIVRTVCRIDDIDGAFSPEGPWISSVKFTNQPRYFDLGQVGHGLRQAVLLLALNHFCQNTIILVDEPESNLHPELLARILDHVKSSARNYWILATHSNILLRPEFSTSLYTCRFDGNEPLVTPESQRLQALEMLGYASIDNLAADVLILVEGPSDCTAIRVLLERKISGRRARSYTVLHMGGSAMADFSVEDFYEKYHEIFAILDGETESSAIKARLQFKETNASFIKDECIFELSGYALENYWSEAILRCEFGSSIPSGIEFPIEGSIRAAGLPDKKVKKHVGRIAGKQPLDELFDLGNSLDMIVNKLIYDKES